MTKEKCGIILLHGWNDIVSPWKLSAKTFVTSSTIGLGLKNCSIKEPKAPHRAATFVPHSFAAEAIGVPMPRSWFDFKMMPALCVCSDEGGESKEDLQEALTWVEREINTLIEEGVPTTKIIVMGFSQGGALTLYTAVHTKYKLGGFIPFGAWLPLLKCEPITELSSPVNKDTPILQLHGLLDELVFYNPAATKTKDEMNKVFTKYQFETASLATHCTTLSLKIGMVRSWLKTIL